MNKLICAALLATTGMMLIPITTNASQLLYFYSATGTLVNAQDSNGNMSSYLARGMRFDGTNTTYAVSNHKDVTTQLDSNGTVSQKYNYTAYGVPTAYSDSSTNASKRTTSTAVLSITQNPYSYSDYYTDEESSNYYLNARYYDPVIGTFLTFDTYNLPNRYAYVNGNPVMATDPTGHWEIGIGRLFAYGGDRAIDNSWFNITINKKMDNNYKDQWVETKKIMSEQPASIAYFTRDTKQISGDEERQNYMDENGEIHDLISPEEPAKLVDQNKQEKVWTEHQRLMIHQGVHTSNAAISLDIYNLLETPTNNLGDKQIYKGGRDSYQVNITLQTKIYQRKRCMQDQ